jgi:PIN domain nuclease of toxin-antitoxin system
MNYLLYTHTFLWFINADSSLSATARALIEEANNAVFLSIASVWEMAIKVILGKLEMPSPFADFITEQLYENNIGLYPIQVAHTGLVVTLPLHHRDPFDWLIIAQSVAEQIPLLDKIEYLICME